MSRVSNWVLSTFSIRIVVFEIFDILSPYVNYNKVVKHCLQIVISSELYVVDKLKLRKFFVFYKKYLSTFSWKIQYIKNYLGVPILWGKILKFKFTIAL